MANNISPLVLVIAGLALASCGKEDASGGPGASAQCNPNSCQIKVSVAGTCSNASDITVVPDKLPVPKEFHHLKIHWEILTEGFKFAPEPTGITFTTPPLPPPNEFNSPNATAGGKKYDLTDENSPGPATGTDYKYNIQLLRADGSSCARKDPIIHNGA